MLKKLIIPGMFVFVTILSSCGANKKLAASKQESDQLRSEVNQLQATNKQLNNNVNSLQAQVDKLIAANQSVNTEFSKYKQSCEETKEDLAYITDVLEQEYKTLQEVEKKIKIAMADFENKGVDVYYKNGLVYVDMQSDLLYKSGSSAIGKEGKSALGALATALNDYPKLKVIVLGHTDDQKLKSSDNWSLSTERANGIVRTLRDDYKVDPTRLTSAGKGKYAPVADNSTADGRAQNRRTEIILNPDLDKLWETARASQ
jgi:chemotaxis protein MotB